MKITITGIFNDFFTNYEDKEDSVSFEIDDELGCSCYKENGRCLVHFPPESYVISDINEKQISDD
jgi:hypothetical protein